MRFRAIRIFSVLSITAVLVILLVARRAGSDLPSPPTDCLMTINIDGHPGDSMVVRDAIDVDSFSWGVSRPHTEHPPGGRVDFSDFTFVKRIDRASPNLMLACASGEHVRSATFEERRPGDPHPFLKYTLEDVLVTSFKPGGTCDGGQTPSEEVMLNFGRIIVEFSEQRGDGGIPERACWDVRARRPC